MSARTQGSWRQFRSAVEEFHGEATDTDKDDETGDDQASSDLPVYQGVRMALERLAHAEFVFSGTERRWRIVPPAMVVTQQGTQWVGILCGARSPGLINELTRLPSTVSQDVQEASGMPDRIRLLASSLAELSQVGEQLQTLVQIDAPSALLAAIPPVDDPRSRYPAEPPVAPGWTIEHFSTATLRWEAAGYHHVREATEGLFRFVMKYQRFHYLRWQGRTFRVPVQVGKYAILRRRRTRKLVGYDRDRGVLSVPVTCRPPLLIERALVICSGLLACLNPVTGRLEYSEVPLSVAQMAAGLLRQELERR